ncbi:hypothetical protein [Rheinheimera nanhaiensis]|uniref:hypothetical protein n=1 Tax=Rheinheimera nanhaiensis TaxID=1163621 RepID=UPI00058C6BA9|nr:hypothetical protein [Rheinheimera nanhaiensis]
MSTEIIKHKHLSGHFLVRDNINGSVSEVNALPPGQQPRKKASYIKHDGKFIGVYASGKGPVMFINETVLPFVNQSWTVTLAKLNGRNQFIVQQDGRELFKTDYQPPAPDDLDPWSDAESVDLFSWIAAKRNDSEIFQMWTTT